MRHTATMGLVWLVLIVSAAQAATFGQNPFTNLAGTGTVTANGNAAPGTWYDKSVQSSAYLTKVSGVMYYQSKWATPTTVGAVLVDGDGRQAGGNIYVSTTAGPDAATSVARPSRTTPISRASSTWGPAARASTP